jgi:ABC-type nickel/cobalt efflux system permease component RcnA
MSVESAAAWASVIGTAVLVIGGVWNFFRRIEKRLDKQDQIAKGQADDLKDIKSENARQYGGNSGGMREAINHLVKGQDEIKTELQYQRTRLDAHIDSHE